MLCILLNKYYICKDRTYYATHRTASQNMAKLTFNAYHKNCLKVFYCVTIQLTHKSSES